MIILTGNCKFPLTKTACEKSKTTVSPEFIVDALSCLLKSGIGVSLLLRGSIPEFSADRTGNVEQKKIAKQKAKFR